MKESKSTAKGFLKGGHVPSESPAPSKADAGAGETFNRPLRI